jgi:hypothetical protein
VWKLKVRRHDSDYQIRAPIKHYLAANDCIVTTEPALPKTLPE